MEVQSEPEHTVFAAHLYLWSCISVVTDTMAVPHSCTSMQTYSDVKDLEKMGYIKTEQLDYLQ